MKIFRRIVDWCLWIRVRLAARRDLLAQLDLRLETERERHQREENRLNDEIKLRDLQIKTLSAYVEKLQAVIERDTAILTRQTAEAQFKPPGST